MCTNTQNVKGNVSGDGKWRRASGMDCFGLAQRTPHDLGQIIMEMLRVSYIVVLGFDGFVKRT